MNKFFRSGPALAFALLACVLCVAPVLAVDVAADSPVVDPVVTAPADTAAPADNVLTAPSGDDSFSGDVVVYDPVVTYDPPVVNITFPEPVYPAYSVTSAVRSESVFEGYKALIVQLFGEYEPRMENVTVYAPDGSIHASLHFVPGLAGLDWSWIVGVFLFSLSLYCVFRNIGGIIKCL